jgi:ferric-dicitrate binding protein FerR (iron transport regulator)
MTDELLVKYLVGECSKEEQDAVMAWKTADPFNKKRFESLEWIWMESHKINQQSKVDVDKAWNSFIELRDRAEEKQKKGRAIPLSGTFSRVLAIAASFLIILTLYYLKWNIDQKSDVTKPVAYIKLQTFENTLTDTLPDGTIITLNKNSALSYPEVFSDTQRNVKMEGEIFFEVARNEAKPFIIETERTDITVLGTSFNVETQNTFTRVIVETGLVEVDYKKGNIIVEPGQQLTIQKSDSLIQKVPVSDELYKYYRSRVFVCDNTPLATLVDKLNEAYGAAIIIVNPAKGNLKITTTFADESLENILDIIALTLDVKIIKTKENILIQ